MFGCDVGFRLFRDIFICGLFVIIFCGMPFSFAGKHKNSSKIENSNIVLQSICDAIQNEDQNEINSILLYILNPRKNTLPKSFYNGTEQKKEMEQKLREVLSIVRNLNSKKQIVSAIINSAYPIDAKTLNTLILIIDTLPDVDREELRHILIEKDLIDDDFQPL